MFSFDLSAAKRFDPRERGPRELEKQIWSRTVFKDIDLKAPESSYHREMLRGLIYQRDHEEPSLIRKILTAKERGIGAIEEVVVEAIVAQDISFKVGTKRDVDRFTFRFQGGKEFEMTVSLDRYPYERTSDSASLAEAETLGRFGKGVKVFQEFFGAGTIPCSGGRKGLICKEYLPGEMLSDLLARTQEESERVSAERAVVRMIQSAILEAKGLPVDSHGKNIILHTAQSKELAARFCDVEYLRQDYSGIQSEVERIACLFGKSADDFLKSHV